MTARDQAPHRPPSVKGDTAPRDDAGKGDHAKREQGIVKDERGQEQPRDKKRAEQNR